MLAVGSARRLEPLNDLSVPETRAPGVWNEFGKTGRGVVVGVVDTGIDWRHADFKAADTTGAPTRIKALLDLSQLGSGPLGAAGCRAGATAMFQFPPGASSFCPVTTDEVLLDFPLTKLELILFRD